MRADRGVSRLTSRSGLPLAVAGTVLLFLFAVQLLGASTEAADPWLRRGSWPCSRTTGRRSDSAG